MLNVTTTLSYGLRFLVNLATSDKCPKRLERIAREEDISLAYLRKLTPFLEKAGLIKSCKGPGGGFMLKRKPSEISLLEVISTLSKNRVRHCLQKPSLCIRYNECLVKDLWKKIHIKFEELFRNKTLATIIKVKKNDLF
jgi:Rrf2 family protein